MIIQYTTFWWTRILIHIITWDTALWYNSTVYGSLVNLDLDYYDLYSIQLSDVTLQYTILWEVRISIHTTILYHLYVLDVLYGSLVNLDLDSYVLYSIQLYDITLQYTILWGIRI